MAPQNWKIASQPINQDNNVLPVPAAASLGAVRSPADGVRGFGAAMVCRTDTACKDIGSLTPQSALDAQSPSATSLRRVTPHGARVLWEEPPAHPPAT